MPAMKFLLFLINLCSLYGSWAESVPVADLNRSDLKALPVEPENSNLNNNSDLVFQPVLLIKLFKGKHTSEFLIPLENNLENNVYSDDDQQNENGYKRATRSTYILESPEITNGSYDDDLSLAESSIPFHPLFSIRHRKEVKRRYYSRRNRT